MFNEAEAVINVEARNDGLSAVVAMETAERVYSSLQKKGKRQMTTLGMSKQAEQRGDFSRENTDWEEAGL